ncbi:MAG: YlxR family protein [Clostridia bacterium]|nr:YlxR family protein [Clostridia bacterium]
MPKTRKIPLRMCVVCRQLKEKKEMLRLVKGADDNIIIDITSKAPGRGAYICDNPECVEKLRKKKLLGKIFSCAVDDGVYDAIEEAYFGRGREQD